MTANDLAGAACVGEFHLFDSTNELDHAEARLICRNECPVRDACEANLAEIRKDGAYRLEGTWAGELFVMGKPARERKPGPKAAPDPKPLKVVSATPERKFWSTLDDCSHCGSKTGEPCRSPGGAHVSAHRARIKVGCQDCGTEIGPRLRVCADCRTERTRASWRKTARRRYAEKKGAA